MDGKNNKSLTLTPWGTGGDWIRTLRRNAQITAAEFAEQVSAPSLAWVLEVEAGLRPVPSSMYKGYAKHLGVMTSEFAATCLRHYDRKAYEALFGTDTPSFSAAAA